MTMITERRSTSHPSLWAAAGAAIGHVVTTVQIWRERAWQRRQLLFLSDQALRDIGRSRAEALREARQPFWRIESDLPT
jgi:uncharacterized protein YjiS (DUF1127 family)